MNTTLALWFMFVSQANHLPPGLLSALCWEESRHKVQALNLSDGGSASFGVCQIKYETAKNLGYSGTPKQLMRYDNNIYWAGEYLKKQVDRYDGDLRKAVAAYNAGKWQEDARSLTKNRHYVSKVFKSWSEDK